MKTGHGFTVQGRFPVSYEADVEQVLCACDVKGVMDAAVSFGDGYLGVTGYIVARDSGEALRKMQEAIIIPADRLEILA